MLVTLNLYIMRQFYLYLMVIICTVFLNGCSKDDENGNETNPNTEVVLPKEAYRLQIVEAKFSKPLPQEEYDGNLGGIPIKLIRSEEQTFIFYIPGEVAVGEAVLTVPQLNVSASFEIKNPELKGSVEEVLQPVLKKTTPEYQEISDSEYSTYLTTVNTVFNDYYQTLSEKEKNDMALFYQVNEDLFSEILNPSVQKGKGVKETLITIGKFSVATYLFVEGSVLLAFPGTPVEKALLAAVAITGAVKAWDYGKELVNQVKIVTEIDYDFSMDRPVYKAAASSPLTFENDKSRSLSLYVEQRSMTGADRSNTANGLATFFGIYNKLTSVSTTVNNIISFVNDNLFFANIPQIPIKDLPNSSETQRVPVSAEHFEYLKFTVANSNVEIKETSFKNGSISMKITVKDVNAVAGNTINTQLNYTYNEDFNNVSGSFPIEINLNKNPFVGDWLLTERDGQSAGEWFEQAYHDDCNYHPSNLSIYTGTATFGDTSFNVQSDYIQSAYDLFLRNSDGSLVLDHDGKRICSGTQTQLWENRRKSSYSGNYSFSQDTAIGVLVSVNDQHCVGSNPPTGLQIRLISENVISVTIPGNCVSTLRFERQ